MRHAANILWWGGSVEVLTVEMAAFVLVGVGTFIVGSAMVVAHAVGLGDKQSRRAFTVLHHIIVAGIAVLSRSRLVCVTALVLEVGFEVSDTVSTVLGHGSWTGLPGVAVYVHHVFSAALEIATLGLLLDDTLSFDRVAPFLFIFIGSGATDLCWAKILTFERHTTRQWLATTLYSAVFVYLRVVLFVSEGLSLLSTMSSPTSFVILAHVSFVIFCTYHALLGIGIAFAWRNGGRLPEKAEQNK